MSSAPGGLSAHSSQLQAASDRQHLPRHAKCYLHPGARSLSSAPSDLHGIYHELYSHDGKLRLKACVSQACHCCFVAGSDHCHIHLPARPHLQPCHGDFSLSICEGPCILLDRGHCRQPAHVILNTRTYGAFSEPLRQIYTQSPNHHQEHNKNPQNPGYSFQTP